MGSSRDSRWLFIGLAAAVAWDLAGFDLAISRLFAGPGGFFWRDHWLASTVLHEGARAVAWLVFAVLIAGLWWPLRFARDLPRSQRVAWLAATAVCVILIGALKQASLTSCPWSLAEFGGEARYVSHWAFGVRDGGPGRCFPAGHANAALCFLPGYFFLRQTAPIAARRWLLATVAAGFVLGMTQVVRGAHFFSHMLWTGWWCWAVSVAAIGAARALRPREPVIGVESAVRP